MILAIALVHVRIVTEDVLLREIGRDLRKGFAEIFDASGNIR
jgi:hypothetical protein